MPSDRRPLSIRLEAAEETWLRRVAARERLPVNVIVKRAVAAELDRMGREMTYTAAIGTAPDVVAGEFCDVSVIINDAEGNLTDTAVMQAETEIRTDHEDVLGVVEDDAERVLREHGWQIAGEWDVADNALYAPVERQALDKEKA